MVILWEMIHVFEVQCAAWYKRVGPERVRCYSNGMWSAVPVCNVL
ncbi:hypothetical protein FQN60_007004 [Etheostoma spectabile]|uniref:Sushi domain-containing protein n=1 Tax=Etheostoma spectabile TaxID=54343 RepID=A0A5J5CAK4_9PERO|nr:hypothetical protein FQN60_007004 [Etheostoma spectabile]